MLHSLECINKLKYNELLILRNEKWLKYLYFSELGRINIENIKSISNIDKHSVLKYVEKTLAALDRLNISEKAKFYIEEVLKWSEVSKCGHKYQRAKWDKKGYNLFVHNVGSAQIYSDEYLSINKDYLEIKDNYIIYVLILTHGLLGQYIRGEVNFSESIPLSSLLDYFDKKELEIILYSLNQCIIEAVSPVLWNNIKDIVYASITTLLSGKVLKEQTVYERLNNLRTTSIRKGENFKEEYNKYLGDKALNIDNIFQIIFSKCYLWYVEVALSDFTFEEFIKIFLYIYKESNILKVNHISFEKLMKDIYYDYKGNKTENIYKKRIIEKYLSQISFNDIINGNIPNNKHVNFKINSNGYLEETVSFSFEFSNASSKLIEFCQAAEEYDIMYERAIILLYDLFGFRRDEYDRFHNEKDYLNTMNSTVSQKSIILDYIVGDKIIDVGPGGGALMDLIVERYPNKDVLGLDVSVNVIEELKKRKQLENRRWSITQGNILSLEEVVKSESVSTIIFSSIIHELFSYIPYEGRKFNYDTIKIVLQKSFNALHPGGRIIIRDGIMTEPENDFRIIKFKDKDGFKFLQQYKNDFKGRVIEYVELQSDTDICVKMPVNDAMEFLYTYTWGKDSYAHEVQEQFGYFTPSKYKEFIKDSLGDKAKIGLFKYFLQEGYSEHLLQKIEFYDENFHPVPLPDSTCLIVIEKEL